MNYEQAKRLISKKLQTELYQPYGMERYKMVLMLRTGIEATTEKGRIYQPVPLGINLEWLIKTLCSKESYFVTIRFTGKRAANLVELTKHHPTAWDAAKELAAKILEQGDPLPPELRQFTIKVLRGEEGPNKQGRYRAENLYRDQCVADAIYTLHECGFKPLTKNSNDSQNNSACHVVVEALAKLGDMISYEAVRSIWKNHKEFC
ncbi:MAG: hypothetical protein K2Y01_07180 [Rhabdochlamydiaceae bacterium]|jgi:hypothetical protein|nr:hypothetical protein [Rhabdochlamydiaceae bacterium]